MAKRRVKAKSSTRLEHLEQMELDIRENLETAVRKHYNGAIMALNRSLAVVAEEIRHERRELELARLDKAGKAGQRKALKKILLVQAAAGKAQAAKELVRLELEEMKRKPVKVVFERPTIDDDDGDVDGEADLAN